MIASRRRRPSPAGRRVALDRKWRVNVAHYGGRVMLLTITGAGQDLLPEGDAEKDGTYSVTIKGREVVKVRPEWIYRELYERTAQARASRLMEAAQRAADRFVRAQGYEGKLPRRLGNVRAPQARGVSHIHELLPMETHWERVWSRTVSAFVDRAWRYEEQRWSEDERRLFIEAEYRGEKVPKRFYGFGFVKRGNPAGRSSTKAASYMARNAAGYMAGNGGRHYVSTRLTRETGVTMRALRACNWLHVREKLIAAGELDELVPSYWSREWAAEVLRVYRLVTAPSAAP